MNVPTVLFTQDARTTAIASTLLDHITVLVTLATKGIHMLDSLTLMNVISIHQLMTGASPIHTV